MLKNEGVFATKVQGNIYYRILNSYQLLEQHKMMWYVRVFRIDSKLKLITNFKLISGLISIFNFKNTNR